MPNLPLHLDLQATISIPHTAFGQLLQTPDLRNTHPHMNLLPSTKRRFSDPHLAAYITNSRHSLGLPQGKRYLLVA